MENVMTTVQVKVADMYSRMDKKLKTYTGGMPYGMKKATPKEQRDMFENLDAQGLAELINKHGPDSVNEWLGKHMNKPQGGY